MRCFSRLSETGLRVSNSLFFFEFPGIEKFEEAVVTPNSRSLPYYEARATRFDGSEVSYQMWDDLPIIRISDDSEESLFSMNGEHWTIRAVRLNAFTDDVDTLTEVNEYNLFFRGIQKTLKADILFFESTLTDEAFILISETPYHVRGELSIKQNRQIRTSSPVVFKNGGYPVVIGACKKGECEALCRNYLRHANNAKNLITMSNTWGDCNGDSRVCEEFIYKEIETAKEIGVDIVQIDDGWQVGNTLYPIPRDEIGCRIFDDPCWDLNTERFPNGIMPLAKFAEKQGIKIGMWFAPSSHNGFALLERDKAVMKKAYFEYGARFFKLDMYRAKSKEETDKVLELIKYIYSLGDDVSVQMDVTRNDRLNYLCGREYGTVFVENRYTKTANSFPHRVLRNLWDICRYVPSNRFQFELVNPDLYKDSYYEGDPLAPSLYDMDYLFSTVMLSNPLFWFELQHLSKARKDELKKIMPVFCEHRERLANADVMPIGEKPDGTSLTGFLVTICNKAEYILAFREFTERDEMEIKLKEMPGKVELLCSNADVRTEAKEGALKISFSKPRAYAFLKLS